MLHVDVDGFDSWRIAARRLLAEGVQPNDVRWRQGRGRSLRGLATAAERARAAAESLDPHGPPGQQLLLTAGPVAARVPRPFLQLAECVACFRPTGKWKLLYRVLWRLVHGERHLLEVTSDRDVRRLLVIEKLVRRDTDRMQREARFFRCQGGEDAYRVAAFKPEHLTLRRAAPFFIRRFGIEKWAVLTPDESAYWDGRLLRFGPGVAWQDALKPDQLGRLWRDQQAKSFNPERIPLAAAARVPPTALGERSPRAEFENGPPDARLVFLTGQPRLLDGSRPLPLAGAAAEVFAAALRSVGLDAAEVHVTSDFEFFHRAQLRDAGRPQMLVCLGASAARSALGPNFRLTLQHGQLTETDWADWTMATYHPAAMLRVPDESVRARMHEQFLYDLRRAAEQFGSSCQRSLSSAT